MRKLQCAVFLLSSVALLACHRSKRKVATLPPTQPNLAIAETPPAVGFVHVADGQIVDGQNRPLLLRGVGFGNQVWTNVAGPWRHHAEADYARVASMNMNAVRFYMNDITFEDPKNPEQWKESGWAWLDQNIAWAKRNRIYLILNLHVPPGGYQSFGGGTELWTSARAQMRLLHLWQAIAARYRNEPNIAGYDLLHEPVVTRATSQWKQLAQQAIQMIRRADSNHMIIVERVTAVGLDWSENAERNFVLVDDPNVVYEFHFYKPSHFTRQNSPWAPLFAPDAHYPDPERLGIDWYNTAYKATVSYTPPVPRGDSGWKHYQGIPFTVADPSHVIGRPALRCAKNKGKVWFDDLTIEQLDQRGNPINTLSQVNLQSRRGWYLWTSNGVGTASDEALGHQDALSASISATSGEANLSAEYLQIRLKQGATYRISGWMKGSAVSSGAQCMIRLDAYSAKAPIHAWDRQFLARELDAYLEFGRRHHVPMFLGEFGTIRQSFADDRGGLRWVSDMLELLEERQLSYTYHNYHEPFMGLFYNEEGLPDPGNANRPLVGLLQSKLATPRVSVAQSLSTNGLSSHPERE